MVTSTIFSFLLQGDDLDAVVKITEILAREAIPDVAIHPLSRYLDSGSFTLGEIYKAVLGTTF
jgi:hypothetical protein